MPMSATAVDSACHPNSAYDLSSCSAGLVFVPSYASPVPVSTQGDFPGQSSIGSSRPTPHIPTPPPVIQRSPRTRGTYRLRTENNVLVTLDMLDPARRGLYVHYESEEDGHADLRKVAPRKIGKLPFQQPFRSRGTGYARVTEAGQESDTQPVGFPVTWGSEGVLEPSVSNGWDLPFKEASGSSRRLRKHCPPPLDLTRSNKHPRRELESPFDDWDDGPCPCLLSPLDMLSPSALKARTGRGRTGRGRRSASSESDRHPGETVDLDFALEELFSSCGEVTNWHTPRRSDSETDSVAPALPPVPARPPRTRDMGVEFIASLNLDVLSPISPGLCTPRTPPFRSTAPLERVAKRPSRPTGDWAPRLHGDHSFLQALSRGHDSHGKYDPPSLRTSEGSCSVSSKRGLRRSALPDAWKSCVTTV